MSRLERCNYTARHTLMSSFVLVHENVGVFFFPGGSSFPYFNASPLAAVCITWCCCLPQSLPHLDPFLGLWLPAPAHHTELVVLVSLTLLIALLCLVWEIASLGAGPPRAGERACLEDAVGGETAHTTCRKCLSCLPWNCNLCVAG